MKLMVCGSRKIIDKEFVFSCIDNIMSTLKGIDTIIEGDATGVDKLAGVYAIMKGFKLVIKKPKWKVMDYSDPEDIVEVYDKSAGIKRNSVMVELCDYGIAIWDKKSRGTLDSINKLKESNKLLKIYYYTNKDEK